MIICDGCGREIKTVITVTAFAPGGARSIYGVYGRECARRTRAKLLEQGVETTRVASRA